MTTAVRPASGKKWEEEIPEFITVKDGEEHITRYGNDILEVYAMDARFGFDPKLVGIPLPEGLDPGERVTLIQLWNIRENFLKADPRNGEDEGKFAEHGRYLWWLLRLWVSQPEVGHFVGRGFKGNEEAADRWLGK